MKKNIFSLAVVGIFLANMLSVSAAQHVFLEDPFKNQNNSYTYTYSNSQAGYQNSYSYDNRYGADYYRYNNNYNYYDYNRYSPNYQNNQYYYNPYTNSYQYNPYYNGNYNGNYYWNQYINPYYLPYDTASSRYPGCSRDDIVIGGQVWASCNALDRRTGSDNRSGWFFLGDMYPTFYSWNGRNNYLHTQDKKFQMKSWALGPCAAGYRLPTTGDWSVLSQYAKNNSTTVARILNLPYNGAYMGYRDARNNVSVDARLNIGGAYWTATPAVETPFVMHLGSTLAGYRSDGTDISRMDAQYRWQCADNSMQLIPGLYQELANVRCIKDM